MIALETHKLLFLQIGFPEAFTEPCIASLKTITNMTRCPANLSSFEAAARRKNCSSLAGGARNCKSFQYHCVLGEDLMSAIELCAPSIYIIGRYTCILIKKCYKHLFWVLSLMIFNFLYFCLVTTLFIWLLWILLTDSVCTTFSTYHKSIIRVQGLKCSECPWSYNSTNAYQCKSRDVHVS